MAAPYWPCRDCAGVATYFGPDPYWFDMTGDQAEVHLCEPCYLVRLELVPDD